MKFCELTDEDAGLVIEEAHKRISEGSCDNCELRNPSVTNDYCLDCLMKGMKK